MQVFNKERALELVDGDEGLLEILIESFMTENKFERSELDALVSAGKLSEAAGYVHATKGAARQLCMEKLQESGQRLEDVLRGKTQGDVMALSDRMFEDYEEAMKVIL
ncbi:MAG: Hpt domain-containing protein [Treponema sp.]|nr:Hpt domain-containing protein [Candidatus Treponema equifaecale]